MTIYIVTSGEYSSYGINAVFTDKKQAELYCATKNNSDDYYRFEPCRIEEYEADTHLFDGEVYYGIRFRTNDGRVEYVEKIYSTSPVTLKVERLQAWRDDFRVELPTNRAYAYSGMKKIAQDYLAKMKAEEKGL